MAALLLENLLRKLFVYESGATRARIRKTCSDAVETVRLSGVFSIEILGIPILARLGGRFDYRRSVTGSHTWIYAAFRRSVTGRRGSQGDENLWFDSIFFFLVKLCLALLHLHRAGYRCELAQCDGP